MDRLRAELTRCERHFTAQVEAKGVLEQQLAGTENKLARVEAATGTVSWGAQGCSGQ